MTNKPKRKYTRRTPVEQKPTDQAVTTEHQDFEAKMEEPKSLHENNALPMPEDNESGPSQVPDVAPTGEPTGHFVNEPEMTRRRSTKLSDDKPEPEREVIPKASLLGHNEITGLVQEAIWAHDMQDDVMRFDTLGRKWTFRPDQNLGHTIFYIECAIPALSEHREMSNNRFGLDGTGEEIEAIIRALNEAVR
jgi:hypothetical protein